MKLDGPHLSGIGALMFIVRYVPFFNVNLVFVNRVYSLDEMSGVCNSIVGLVIPNCGIVKLLDMILLVGAAVLFIYGLYLSHKGKKITI